MGVKSALVLLACLTVMVQTGCQRASRTHVQLSEASAPTSTSSSTRVSSLGAGDALGWDVSAQDGIFNQFAQERTNGAVAANR